MSADHAPCTFPLSQINPHLFPSIRYRIDIANPWSIWRPAGEWQIHIADLAHEVYSGKKRGSRNSQREED